MASIVRTRGRVAGLVDVAVAGAASTRSTASTPASDQRRGERLARRAQFVALAHDDQCRREPVAVTEAGERPADP